jgi:hypothetical protein
VLDGWKQKAIKFVVYYFIGPELVVAVQICWRGTVQNYFYHRTVHDYIMGCPEVGFKTTITWNSAGYIYNGTVLQSNLLLLGLHFVSLIDLVGRSRTWLCLKMGHNHEWQF